MIFTFNNSNEFPFFATTKTEMMKRLTSISGVIMFLTSLIMVSCEKEKPLNEQILGTWEVQSIKQVNYENNIKVSETTIYTKANSLAFQFVEGGTGIQFTNNNVYGVFNWTMTGNILKIDQGNNKALEWTITIDKEVLVWSFTETEVDGTITYKYEYFYTAGKTKK
jgi:hypothetical protein